MPTLPTEIILHIATYLAPLDQETLIRTFSHLARLFTFRQFKSTDENGDTILHLQARTHRRRVPKAAPDARKGPCFLALITSNPGSSLHPQNNAGVTPLMSATRAHNLQFMRLLLAKDPEGQPLTDVNHRKLVHHYMWEDKDIEVTPLIWALGSGLGAYELISPFLAHPAIDLACVNGDGRNPLMLAVMGYGDDDRVHLILERRRQALATIPPGLRDDPVAGAAVSGNFDVNAVDRCRGETALQIAASENAGEAVQLILSQDGVQADMADLLHRTTNQVAIEAILAHGGVDVDHPDQFGRSALSNAAVGKNRKSALVLLRYGARPDLKDLEGYTPISRAAVTMHADMVELLEEAIGII